MTREEETKQRATNEFLGSAIFWLATAANAEKLSDWDKSRIKNMLQKARAEGVVTEEVFDKLS